MTTLRGAAVPAVPLAVRTRAPADRALRHHAVRHHSVRHRAPAERALRAGPWAGRRSGSGAPPRRRARNGLIAVAGLGLLATAAVVTAVVLGGGARARLPADHARDGRRRVPAAGRRRGRRRTRRRRPTRTARPGERAGPAPGRRQLRVLRQPGHVAQRVWGDVADPRAPPTCCCAPWSPPFRTTATAAAATRPRRSVPRRLSRSTASTAMCSSVKA
ncbi:hypothetical protein NKH77_18330 [Streptomyces sp. M19]